MINAPRAKLSPSRRRPDWERVASPPLWFYPDRKRRPSTRGTPRGLLGSIGLTTLHPSVLSSCRTIPAPFSGKLEPHVRSVRQRGRDGPVGATSQIDPIQTWVIAMAACREKCLPRTPCVKDMRIGSHSGRYNAEGTPPVCGLDHHRTSAHARRAAPRGMSSEVRTDRTDRVGDPLGGNCFGQRYFDKIFLHDQSRLFETAGSG